jgi:hypothetical protein
MLKKSTKSMVKTVVMMVETILGGAFRRSKGTKRKSFLRESLFRVRESGERQKLFTGEKTMR